MKVNYKGGVSVSSVCVLTVTPVSAKIISCTPRFQGILVIGVCVGVGGGEWLKMKEIHRERLTLRFNVM